MRRYVKHYRANNERFKKINEKLKVHQRSKSKTSLGYQGDNKIEGDTSGVKNLNNNRLRKESSKGKVIAKPTCNFCSKK